MKIVATRKAEQNQAIVDPWTAVHAGAGLAAGLVDLPFAPAMVAAVVFEVGEHFYEGSRAESPGNVAADLAIFAAGWWLGRRFNRS